MQKKEEKMFYALQKVDMCVCYAKWKIILACPYVYQTQVFS